MAWFAVVFAFIFVPLLALSADLPRMLWVRNHLQTAADAAAEGGANLGVDVPRFRESGEVRYIPAVVHGYVRSTFAEVVADAGLLGYQPTITRIHIDEANDTVWVEAEATADVFIPAITPAVTIRIQAVSQSRLVARSP